MSPPVTFRIILCETLSVALRAHIDNRHSCFPRSITISLSRVFTHAAILDRHARRVFIRTKVCVEPWLPISSKKEQFRGIFQARGKKRNERTRGESQRTGEESASSSLARVPCCATHYRQSHVGAQRPIIVFPPGQSAGRETSLGMILLRMNYGANRYGNGWLRRRRGHGEPLR